MECLCALQVKIPRILNLVWPDDHASLEFQQILDSMHFSAAECLELVVNVGIEKIASTWRLK